MKKCLVGLSMVLLSVAAFAHDCTDAMEVIDLKLTGSPRLSSADMSRTMDLRVDGEKLHKEGKHAEAMQALAAAKKLLGM